MAFEPDEPRAGAGDRREVPVRAFGGAAARCISRRSRTAGSRPTRSTEVAELVDLEPAQVLGTCSFYTMYKRDGVKHLVVSVCTNVSCLVNGGPELYEALSEQYARPSDVEVEEVECLAACDTAPVFQVNYEFHGNATRESATARWRSTARGARTRAACPEGSAPDGSDRDPHRHAAAARVPRGLVDDRPLPRDRRLRAAAPRARHGARAHPGRAGEGVGAARAAAARASGPVRSGPSCRRASTRGTWR